MRFMRGVNPPLNRSARSKKRSWRLISLCRKRAADRGIPLENERTLLREQAAMAQERLAAEIGEEQQRQTLVSLSADNQRVQSDADAYAIETKMKAYRELPVENLKALALSRMAPEQLMAMAFESLAQNAGKIGELNIAPDMFSQMMKKVSKA